MKMRRFREHYERLKQWQKMPVDYEFASHEGQHCHNCGHQFTGNYCPYCSQKAGEGPIGWASVRQSVMDVWGLGSRSLPRTVAQLFLRPGYLISDYISGKRQISFPPVKMLFIVAVVVVFWTYYILPLWLGEGFDVYGDQADAFRGLTEWIRTHFVWTYFILSLFYIVPTWILFRHAPRHTLPQGFFIQIFLLVLNLMVSFIVLSPLLFGGYNCYLYASFIAGFAYNVIAYRQLFGYGIWGTLWRWVFIFGTVCYLIASLAFVMFEFDPGAVVGEGDVAPMPVEAKYYFAVFMALLALFIFAIGWGINLIATRKPRRSVRR